MTPMSDSAESGPREPQNMRALNGSQQTNGDRGDEVVAVVTRGLGGAFEASLIDQSGKLLRIEIVKGVLSREEVEWFERFVAEKAAEYNRQQLRLV